MTGRDRTVILVVGVLAAIVGGWLVFIQPKRDEAGRLGRQIAAEQRVLAGQQAAVAAGQIARRRYSAYYAELARLGEAVPSDDEVPSLIVQVQSAARAAGIDFRSLQLASGAGSATPAAPAAAAASGSSATTSGAASGVAANGLPPGVSTSTGGVSTSTGGLPEEPFTFTFTGSFFRLANFLGRLQRFVTATDDRVSVSGRLMTLNSISFGAGPAGFPQISAQVSATTYLVPGAQLGAGTGTAATTPASTTPGASSAVTLTPSATVTPGVR
jgi:hypothetical protein